MAKVLFLGSGRCGKSTISKALQWSSMDEEQREKHPKLTPSPALPPKSTERIRFAAWPTEFELLDGQSKSGTMHLWDFGGQEVYHDTHRLFASQGSLFVIATTSPEIHRARLDREVKDEEEGKRPKLRRQNEYRELKYWLDYIRNALGLSCVKDLAENRHRASILIVHTGAGGRDAARDYLRDQAGSYAALLDQGNLKLGSVDFAQREPSGLKEIIAWMQAEGGRVADQLGVRVPQRFAEVARHCEFRWRERRPHSEIVTWPEWVGCGRGGAESGGQNSERLEERSRAVARYLHQCGRVFQLTRHHRVHRVVIDLQWAVDLIYLLTVHAVVEEPVDAELKRLTGRLFSEAKLRTLLQRRADLFAAANDDVIWPVLLDMLDQCNVCVRVGAQVDGCATGTPAR
ncbi:MAG: hypothetical protein J6386_19435 [Candidatus Synoicihabitans palmerolidicus]|nr:hypothetical protein [Candidatus Synoicihabitans palmerolidicus]